MTPPHASPAMDLGMSERVRPLVEQVRAMTRDEIMPLDEEYETELQGSAHRFKPTKRMTEILETLKKKARERGLWNFWLTHSKNGYGLSTVEYAYLAEEMGWSHLAPEVFNCSAPDTGNMEVLERFCTPEQRAPWLPALMDGKTRSAYLMTEPAVASSDATNISLEARADGDHFVLNGEKWWASGAGAVSRRRRGGLGRAASIIACARSARRNARCRSCASGRWRAKLSASRLLSLAAITM